MFWLLGDSRSGLQEPATPGVRTVRRSVSNGTRSVSADIVFEPVAFIRHVDFQDTKQDPDAAADEPFEAGYVPHGPCASATWRCWLWRSRSGCVALTGSLTTRTVLHMRLAQHPAMPAARRPLYV